MPLTNDIEPESCRDMAEIRAEIDRLDRAILALLGKRSRYVQAAAEFKTSEGAVRAPDRLKAVLEQRRAWAVEEGLDPGAIEQLFRDLVHHFIEPELKTWRSERPPA